MSFEYLIGFRYLKAKRKQAIISVITAISTFGVVLGVAALIIVLAVMSGFESQLRDKILGTNAHIVVMNSESGTEVPDEEAVIKSVLQVKNVIAASPFLYSKVLIGRRNRNDGIMIKGIDPQRAGAVSELDHYMVQGALSGLTDPGGDNPGIVLGEEVAKNLGAGLHDLVRVMIPEGTITPGGVIPRTRLFDVVGIFASGMFEYDSGLAFIHIELARKLFQLGGATSGVEAKVTDIFKAKTITEEIQKVVGSKFWVRDWIDMNRAFFSALKLEKVTMFIILVLIILVAAFNIIGTLTMMVMEKNKDIGILNAMGATSRSVMKIFMIQGMVIGVVGTVVGCVAGIVISVIADTYKLIQLQGDVYYFSYLPFKIQGFDVLLICASSLLISFLATLYPSYQATKLNPVEAIRYE